MKKIQSFLLVLALSIFSPFSHSEDMVLPPFKGLSTKLMDLLLRGDMEGYRQLRKNTLRNVYSGAYSSIMVREMRAVLNRSKMEKALTAVGEQGNNILHSLVHLEQSETLKYESDEMERLLTEELDIIFKYLGAKRFLRLLVKENNHGVSPLQKAVLSKGPAYEALRAVIQKRGYHLRSGFVDGIAALGFTVVGGVLLFDADLHVMDGVVGLLSAAFGFDLCHTAFSKYKNFKKTDRELSYPVEL